LLLTKGENTSYVVLIRNFRYFIFDIENDAFFHASPLSRHCKRSSSGALPTPDPEAKS
jgi:hypothetical protein